MNSQLYSERYKGGRGSWSLFSIDHEKVFSTDEIYSILSVMLYDSKKWAFKHDAKRLECNEMKNKVSEQCYCEVWCEWGAKKQMYDWMQ